MSLQEAESQTLALMADKLGLPPIIVLPRDVIMAAAMEATTLAEAGKIEAARRTLKQAIERTEK